MRTIKFRAFFAKTGEMIYFDKPFLLAEYSVLSFMPVEKEYQGIGRLPCGLEDTDDVIVEQFTGLLDKNGKEIYEGDILDDGGGTGEVRWIPEHCAFCVVSPDCGIGASFHHLESGDGKRLLVTVVIGNIHEDKSEVKG